MYIYIRVCVFVCVGLKAVGRVFHRLTKGKASVDGDGSKDGDDDWWTLTVPDEVVQGMAGALVERSRRVWTMDGTLVA